MLSLEGGKRFSQQYFGTKTEVLIAAKPFVTFDADFD